MQQAQIEQTIGGQGTTATIFANKEDIETTEAKKQLRSEEMHRLMKYIQEIDKK